MKSLGGGTSLGRLHPVILPESVNHTFKAPFKAICLPLREVQNGEDEV